MSENSTQKVAHAGQQLQLAHLLAVAAEIVLGKACQTVTVDTPGLRTVPIALVVALVISAQRRALQPRQAR